MYGTLRYITFAAVISVAAALADRATAAPATAPPQRTQTPPSTEMYALQLPFANVVDAARSLLAKNGTVDIADEHVIAGEDEISHYRYVIAVMPAKSNPDKTYLTIDISTGEQPPPHGAAAPRDESRAFIKRLGEKLGTVAQFIRAAN
ncbi:hypothetical protein [Burkholderia sp. BCC0419]|uniref:hypothetical protein n=1 Tax=Burkholderia sp. BCC0419 TaxID=486878 RepID=UPI001FC82C57|nr:hypothetical protein [Burkholderia sp. BCC0419]